MGHGAVVAVLVENRLELLAVLAALTKLGAIGALLNTTQRGRPTSAVSARLPSTRKAARVRNTRDARAMAKGPKYGRKGQEDRLAERRSGGVVPSG